LTQIADRIMVHNMGKTELNYYSGSSLKISQ
jgi:hypothetical protein